MKALSKKDYAMIVGGNPDKCAGRYGRRKKDSFGGSSAVTSLLDKLYPKPCWPDGPPFK